MNETKAEEPASKKAKLEVKESVKESDAHLQPPPQMPLELMDTQQTAAFTVDFPQISTSLLDVLDKYGVAIVTNVLTPDEITLLELKLCEDLAELIDSEALAQADPTVRTAWDWASQEGVRWWPAAALADVGARGRFQDRGLPHGRFAWSCRTHPNVKRVYEVLHQCEDMVSSCDNAFVANGAEEEVVENKSWPHVDQNDHDLRVKDWTVYQGILYLWNSLKPHASTTVIWPGSHKPVVYDLYMADPKMKERMDLGKAHFSLISGLRPGPDRDVLLRGWAKHGRRIPIPAGALLLWQSRTTHQGWSGGPRLAQPVCWEPRSRQDKLMRQRKLRLAALGLPSTHWASLALPHELSALDRSKPAEAKGSEDGDKVHFPLRGSIRSQALTPTADVEELWASLQNLPWMEPLPPAVAELLENSISEPFKVVL